MNRKVPKSLDDYIDRSPAAVRPLLEQMRQTIHKAAPAAVESISYGIPKISVDRHRVYFAGYQRHIGFYPGALAVAAFRHQLSDYKGAKGSVRFPIDQPLPLALVNRMVRFRMKPSPGKGKAK